MISAPKIVNILGIRGLPAAHGGFETFASLLAPYLVEHGWMVNVYCQGEADIVDHEDDYQGVHRIHLAARPGPIGTVLFDWRCVLDARRRGGVNLVLGYNTALFTLILRLGGRAVAMNMDGIEWQRAKWPLPIKLWFYLNEFAGCHLANIPIADHPEIARHLRRHGCTRAEVILYGANVISDADRTRVEELGLVPRQYFVSIARIEPENSILEMVRAFSMRPRAGKLVVLGRMDDSNAYHTQVKLAASDQVLFPGAIYDVHIVSALRFYCLAYMHGHQVGGTNPSLVEALGAGSAVIAHDNRFNRWVAGADQFYFSDEEALDRILSGFEDRRLSPDLARRAAEKRHEEIFVLDNINRQYEAILTRLLQ